MRITSLVLSLLVGATFFVNNSTVQANDPPAIYMNLLQFVESVSPDTKPELRKVIDALKDKNFAGLEVPVGGMEPEFAAYIGDYARRKEMGVTAVGYFDANSNIGSDDATVRAAGKDHAFAMIDASRALADANGNKGPIVLSGPLAAPLKVFAPEGSSKEEHDAYLEKWKENALPIFQEIAEYAEKKLVLLAGEGVQRFETEGFNTAADWHEWIVEVGLDKYPAIGVMIDTCHEIAGGDGKYGYRKTVVELTECGRLWNFHMSAVHRGDVDNSWLSNLLQEFIEPLARVGYGKPITVVLNGKEYPFTPVVSLEIFNPGGALADFLNLRGPKWTFEEAIDVATRSKQAVALAWRRVLAP